jgi:tetratricopeptide (TPR) repeat protein
LNLISLLLLLLSLSAFSMSQEEEKKYDELEGLPFLKALLVDKKFEEVIRQFPSISKSESELGFYFYHLAEAHFALKHYRKAFASLERGARHKRPLPDYDKLWGRSAFHLKSYEFCSEAFKRVKPSSIQGEDWQTFASCLKKNGEIEFLLTLVLKQNLNDFDFALVAQETLIANNLHRAAEEKRSSLLRSCLEVDTYLRLWETLEKVELRDTAVLEIAHACRPESVEVSSLLIKSLFEDGKYHSIAQIFETLSAEDRTYLKHAAEFYKVAGRSTVADYFFIQGDEDGFLLARSSKFLSEENYAGLVTIPFKHEVLSKNKDLAYALAYAHFKFLSLDLSEKTIAVQTKQNAKDAQLKGLIDKCRELTWKCRP